MKKVVIFGDSLAKGVIYDDEKKRYSCLEQPCINRILDKMGYEYNNLSKFGLTSKKAIDYIKKQLSVSHDYEYAIIEIGGNDSDYKWSEISLNPLDEHLSNVELEEFRNNILTIIKNITNYNIIPILITLPPISSKKYFNWLSKNLDKKNIMTWLIDENVIYRHQEMYSACISSIAKDNNIRLIDLRSLLLSYRNYDEYLCQDGIHLNKEGHLLIEKEYEKETI